MLSPNKMPAIHDSLDYSRSKNLIPYKHIFDPTLLQKLADTGINDFFKMESSKAWTWPADFQSSSCLIKTYHISCLHQESNQIHSASGQKHRKPSEKSWTFSLAKSFGYFFPKNGSIQIFAAWRQDGWFSRRFSHINCQAVKDGSPCLQRENIWLEGRFNPTGLRNFLSLEKASSGRCLLSAAASND